MDTKSESHFNSENGVVELDYPGVIDAESQPPSTSTTAVKVPVRLWTVCYSVLTTCLLTMLVGVTITFSSPVLVELTQLKDPKFRLTTKLSDVFGALSLIGGIFGGPIGGWIADKFGRKTSLVLNSAPYLSGYFIILTSSIATNAVVFKVLLMVGRFLSGLGMGWAYVLVGVYIGEIAPSKSRGVFTVMSELSVTFGVLMLLGLGSVPGVHYYHLALVMVGIIALFVYMVLWIPETPRWLLLHSRDKRETVAAMRCLRGPKYLGIDEEIAEIKSTIPKKTPSFREVTKWLFCKRSSLMPFLLLIFLYGYQLASGIAVLSSYTGNIFLEIGVPYPNVTTAFAYGGVKILGVIAALVLVEFAGRKLLLAVSSFGMCLASLLLSMHFFFTRPSLCNNSTVLDLAADSAVDCHPHLYPLAITATVIASISFSLGLGPIPWVLLSEYLPLNVRGLAGGIAGAAAWISAAIVTGSFLSFSEALGAWTAWWTLTCVNCVGFLVIVVCFVETKGKKLEEVQELFATRKLCCNELCFKMKQSTSKSVAKKNNR